MFIKAGRKRYVLLIACAALFIRLAYIIFGFYSKGDSFFVNNDSFSYTDSIINFFEKGIYSFEPDFPDAAFGRLPGYPLFWGLHYLIFGKHAYFAVAITQAVLDSLATYLVYEILINLTKNRTTALLAALIYCSYFFSVFW